jgi:septum site-determining protein MinD
MENSSKAGEAFRNIAGRLLGQNIPLMDIEASSSWFERFSRLVRRS